MNVLDILSVFNELSENELREFIFGGRKAILKRKEDTYKALILDMDFPHQLPHVILESSSNGDIKVVLKFSDVRNIPVPHKGFLRYVFLKDGFKLSRLLRNISKDASIYYLGGERFVQGDLEVFLKKTLFPEDVFQNRILVIESRDKELYDYFLKHVLPLFKFHAKQLRSQANELLKDIGYPFKESMGFDRYEAETSVGMLILSRRYDALEYMVHLSPSLQKRESFLGRESYMWNIQAASSEYSDGTIPTFDEDIYVPSWSFRIMLLNKHTKADLKEVFERSVHGRKRFQVKKPLSKLANALLKYKQVILYGPPGTGKTHLALSTAKEVADEYVLVQMHPSYSYEDFVEGIRPKKDGTFEVQDGIFKRIARKALQDAQRNYVLILDELSRCDVIRVFGELLYLLEYRERPVVLPYSQESFAVPSNLLIIGTMNTADRSVSTLDLAFRRRFAFYKVMPEREAIRQFYLSRNYDPDLLKKVLELYDSINNTILTKLGEDFLLGHTLFMVPPEEFKENFEMKVVPILKDLLSKQDLERVLETYKELIP